MDVEQNLLLIYFVLNVKLLLISIGICSLEKDKVMEIVALVIIIAPTSNLGRSIWQLFWILWCITIHGKSRVLMRNI
jgi:hypothetical protein